MAKTCSFLAGATLAKQTDLNRAISAGKPRGLLNNADISIENGVLEHRASRGRLSERCLHGRGRDHDRPDTGSGVDTNELHGVVQRLDPGLFAMPVLDIIKGKYSQAQVSDYAVDRLDLLPRHEACRCQRRCSYVRRVQAHRLSSRSLTSMRSDRKITASYGAEAGLFIEKDTATVASKISSATDTAQAIVVPLTINVADDAVQSLLVDVQLSAQALVSWSRIESDDNEESSPKPQFPMQG